MKVRSGFVSNSSSSSFTISLDKITGKQLYQILNIDYAAEGYQDCDFPFMWDITVYEDSNVVFGETSMDNFSMSEYFDKIGVDANIVTWGD